MNTFKLRTSLLLAVLALGGSLSAIAAPLGTAFTYQGRLTDGGAVANGNYDLRFGLFTVSGGGVATATVTNLNVSVSNGLFTTTVDFGAGVFAGTAYWLELGTRTNGGGAFTTLAPRQEVTPAPYAIYAAGAPLADNSVTSAKILDGTIAAADLGTGAVTSAKILDGTIANADLGADAVTSGKILDGTITGSDMANNTVTSVQLADSIDLGGALADGFLRLYNGNGASTVYLYGDSGGGAYMTLGTTNGANRLTLDGYGNSGGGQINLYTGDGGTAAILYGDVGGGADLRLYHTNDMRLWLDGYGTGGGGQIQARANDGSYTLNLQGDDGSGAGLVEVKNNAGSTRVSLQGENASGGGQVSLYTPGGVEGTRLKTDSYGGEIRLYDDAGATTVLVDSSSGGGGYATFYQADGQNGVFIDGDSSGAGLLYVYKTNGVAGITLDGNYTGDARIITEELQITGGSDLSENFDIKALNDAPQPGMVVCIDPERPGELAVSTKAYDRTVAGVISGAGGVKPGMLMGQQGTKADGKHPVALTGRVYCLADASGGAIQPGDLLTTSATPGHAMKVSDHARAQGAIVGKAMTALNQGRGLVLVLVSLQ